MDKTDALTVLENMADEEFQEFIIKLPPRTTLLLNGGLVDWRDILPDWYIHLAETARGE